MKYLDSLKNKISISTLSFITTYKCTASCNNCCFKCSPDKEEYLSLKLIKECLDYAKVNIPSIRVVVFTGGEPLVHPRRIYEAIQYANSLGFSTRCVTNAFWANNTSKADKILTELINCGLNEINFSAGSHHQEFIPFDNIENAVKAAIDNDITTIVNFDNSNSYVDPSYIKHEKILKMYEKEYSKFKLLKSNWILWDDIDEVRYIQDKNNRNNRRIRGGCNNVLTKIAITPNSEIFACCGFTILDIPELRLGDLNRDEILDVYNKFGKDDFIKLWIYYSGPQYIIKYLNDNFKVNITGKDLELHPCVACKVLYTSKSIGNIISANRQKIIEDFIAHYITKEKYERMLVQIRKNNHPKLKR